MRDRFVVILRNARVSEQLYCNADLTIKDELTQARQSEDGDNERMVSHLVGEYSRQSISPRLEAAAKTYDQDQQLWAVQEVLGALERQGPSEPTTASGDPR